MGARRYVYFEPSNDAHREHHLLTYEDRELPTASLGHDIKVLIEHYPFTRQIYVLLPNADCDSTLAALADSAGLMRTAQVRSDSDIEVVALFHSAQERRLIEYRHRVLANGTTQRSAASLDQTRIDAWMFDLFNQLNGMVQAPRGVHFGKTSGKHSDRFLRAANVLTSSLVCQTIAYLLLPALPHATPFRLWVDTAPLISCASAVISIMSRLGIWQGVVPVATFSSYKGVHQLSGISENDVVLISASTSGGLVEQVLSIGAKPDNVITLFYVQAKGWRRTQGHVLADMTTRPDATFGFDEVESHDFRQCRWCHDGLLLAEFEGDQFLLQRRRTQTLLITNGPGDEKRTQRPSARAFFTVATGVGAITVRLTSVADTGYPEINIDEQLLFEKSTDFREQYAHLLARHAPAGCAYLISDQLDLFGASRLLSDASIRSLFNEATKAAKTKEVHQLDTVENGAATVAFPVLSDVHTPRTVNQVLRAVLPGGDVAYLAGVVVTETPEEFRQLGMFLRYGSKGPATFVFEKRFAILLRRRYGKSPWEKEFAFLSQFARENPGHADIDARLRFLRSTGRAADGLFWDGQHGALKILSDFVYLDTSTAQRANLSQADVYAVVSNLLSSAQCLNRDPDSRGGTEGLRQLALRSTVYGQVVLDPQNFRNYNDGILRACLLRSATGSELDFSVDPELSEQMFELIAHELDQWRWGRGQALWEFAIALATSHLRLCGVHVARLKELGEEADFLPSSLRQIMSALRVNHFD